MHIDRFSVETDARTTTVDVTDRVREAIPADASGLCTVYVQHTTAGVVVQEAESGLRQDIAAFVDGLVPDEGWQHDRIDDNADSHLRATVLGSDVTIPVDEGEPMLGTWQSVLLVECDGPRTRNVVVTVTGG
ncbi:secondary thiamine-phosphate synthase enzyme YjbQ [Haloarchaeobius sp. HME9146]|uniref:secondary thiamine-phosphate synthase enzyme YjbQ n=1 Tax=Haloarchaeobius sp. HME9146 TaxID=2978732 RepID=UPI0021BEF7E8|nr:secondary thiamine-phosphate synthase enzyme YjbQ [Haloarchaeobius sp. HME9146]MCT9097315.1 secondary thiamine-phosphate synthase enzyme YjbQ [Haloarchaeobius sp. HME9146]